MKFAHYQKRLNRLEAFRWKSIILTIQRLSLENRYTCCNCTEKLWLFIFDSWFFATYLFDTSSRIDSIRCSLICNRQFELKVKTCKKKLLTVQKWWALFPVVFFSHSNRSFRSAWYPIELKIKIIRMKSVVSFVNCTQIENWMWASRRLIHFFQKSLPICPDRCV